MTQNLLTTADTAARLGISARTVHRMAADGRLPSVTKLPGRRGSYLFDAAVVDLILRQTAEKAAS